MTTKKKATSATPTRKPQELPVRAAEGQTQDRAMADLITGGVAGNAFTVQQFSTGTFGTHQIRECVDSLKETANAVHGGDMKHAETVLMAQAAALNAIFGEMARRAAANMGEYLSATETYLRLGLKAQAQCRATLETLAAIKNPPVVFARQANINNGGQQQLNNGTAPPAAPAPAAAIAPAQTAVGRAESLAPPDPVTTPYPTQTIFPAVKNNEQQTEGSDALRK